jgi:hypothetical protein
MGCHRLEEFPRRGRLRDPVSGENNGNPRDENWRLLRPEWRRELANAVTEQNRLSEGGDEKNS